LAATEPSTAALAASADADSAEPSVAATEKLKRSRVSPTGVTDAVRLGVAVCEAVTLAVAEGVSEIVALPESEGVDDGDGVIDGVTLGVSDTEGEAEPPGVTLMVGVAEAVLRR
jgi:hypothetical protein